MTPGFFHTDPSLALATDQYELTMAYAYWKNGMAQSEAEFHMFFRRQPFGGGYVVMAGLEPLMAMVEDFSFSKADLDYLAGLKNQAGGPLFEEPFFRYLENMRFECSMEAVAEGTPVFPNEPIVRVWGPIIQAQLLETLLLNTINFQSLIATKAARCCLAAQGDPVVEFGFRRAQGLDGALSASRAAYLGGCVGTSNTLAGKWWGVPVMGTHAHSWVMLHEAEIDAFRGFARAMPGNCVFLVDTYDTLEGVRNAITVGLEMKARGERLGAIRLDSGDLAYFSSQARKMLDQAGLSEVVVMASNELDEYLIRSLKDQGSAIGAWGVGTKLATATDDPALGGVYKLAAVRQPGQGWSPRLKLSEQTVKVSIPGQQQVFRYLGPDGLLAADAIAGLEETPERVERIIHPNDPRQQKKLDGGLTAELLLKPVFERGKRVYQPPPLSQVRERTAEQLKRLDPSHLRFENPHLYPVGLTPRLNQEREELIHAIREGRSGQKGSR